jgi:hypothetical protein
VQAVVATLLGDPDGDGVGGFGLPPGPPAPPTPGMLPSDPTAPPPDGPDDPNVDPQKGA